jgi:hypothetical protein
MEKSLCENIKIVTSISVRWPLTNIAKQQEKIPKGDSDNGKYLNKTDKNGLL